MNAVMYAKRVKLDSSLAKHYPLRLAVSEMVYFLKSNGIMICIMNNLK